MMLTFSVLRFSQFYAVSIAVIYNVENSEITFVENIKQDLNRSRCLE